MSLFLKVFILKNTLIVLILFMKYSNLLVAKIPPNVNNSLVGILGIWNILILLSRSIKLYTSMRHSITSIMTECIEVFLLCVIFERNINRYFNFLVLNFPASKSPFFTSFYLVVLISFALKKVCIF